MEATTTVTVNCPNCGTYTWQVEVTGWALCRVTRDTEAPEFGSDAELVEPVLTVMDVGVQDRHDTVYVRCAACREEYSLDELDEAADKAAAAPKGWDSAEA